MSSSKFNVWHMNPFSPSVGPVPNPPPLPKYDPNEEAPMWTWRRLYDQVTETPGSELWPQHVGQLPDSDDKPDWRGVIKNNVQVWDLPRRYKFGQKEYKYFWFDTPDYADPFKKLWWSLKWSAWGGLFTYSCVCILRGKDISWKYHKQLVRIAFMPVFTVGMVGSLAVLTIANLRGRKDDLWNYSSAAAIAALYMGRNDFHRGFRYMITLVPLALLTKVCAENNLSMIPKLNNRVRSLGLSGNSTEYGPKSGDLRFGVRSFGKPERSGRDVRDFPTA